MGVLIGHARKDEQGNITGGSAGDQTGKEVSTSSWDNRGWTHVIRAYDEVVANKIANK